jgi:glycerol-3-phosphate acyltransferase PlsY
MPDPISWSQDLPYFAVGFLIAYLIGSIPFGLLLTKFSGVGDIREIGSGSIGATNVLRSGRKGLAIATTLLDGGKGFVAVWFATSYAGPDLAVISAWGSVLGHLFPVWLKFKGGKGVATSLGALFGFAPLLGIYACLTWLSIAFTLRYSSLSGLLAVALTPIYAWYLELFQVAEASILLAILVWARHHTNIRRLLKGEEPKIGAK